LHADAQQNSFPAVCPPGPTGDLIFYTEQLPPCHYKENGTLQGISIDLLEAVMKKTGHHFSRSKVRLVPWTVGYEVALSQNNTGLFMTGRIPQRDSSFKWAGPIYINHNVLFARPDRAITITSPPDLQRYRIGVIADDITVQQLRDLGVNESGLVQETDTSVLIKKLENSTIDLWGYSEATGRYFIGQETGNSSSYRVVYTLPAKEGWYAFNRGVPDATVQEFQQAPDAMKTETDAEGLPAYERIVQRYIPPA
jgi:polar amino acid transport system substrate-binding protein